MAKHIFSLIATACCVSFVGAQGPELDQAPLNYKSGTPNNSVARLQDRIKSGQAKLTPSEDHGYLESLLKELDISVSSQVLVFSKTSFQRERISPKTPRALYFNDDVYVGYCLRGDVLEISVADSNLGTAFYTIDQDPTESLRFVRQTENCLICHASSRNQGYPGHLVRSLYVDRRGFPILSSGSYSTDHTSPLSERWGGWYVTGTHGSQKHLGNFIASDKQRPETEVNVNGLNVTSLQDRFTIANYLGADSDIVALMVLEHQYEMHNRLARASMITRQALYSEKQLNHDLNEPADKRWDSTNRRIASVGESVVEQLFFCGETKLTDTIKGTSTYAEDFEARGPFDGKNRTLRQFDLKTRLFKYPLSYMIYSQTFRELPEEVHSYIWKRVDEVLSGKDTSEKFAHITKSDREAIREILQATVKEMPKGILQ